ncbi:putative transporter [Nakaseomyces bracarensis]|uniref:Transporter n=1 Tax=Nakaseomyces bracarensis TaxID=273131 RepID=A0ABR4NUU5_9SACH
MSISLGAVIWSSVKPIIKIYLIIGTGFLLAKMDILTAEATKTISNIVLTVLLPCLSFNKIVAEIEDQDIKMVGIICLSSVIIFGTGLFFAWVISKTMSVPKQWRGGILAGGMFPNISDLPIAYLQTMDQGFIFTEKEGEKGIANVIIFLAMFLFCVFNLGGFRLIEMDFNYSDEESSYTTRELNGTDPTSSDTFSDNDALEKRDVNKEPGVTNKNDNSIEQHIESNEVVSKSKSCSNSLDSNSESGDLSLISTPDSNEPSLTNNTESSMINCTSRFHQPVALGSETQQTKRASRVTLSTERQRTLSHCSNKNKNSQHPSMYDLIQQYSNVDQYGNNLHEEVSVNNVGYDKGGANRTTSNQSVMDRIRGSNLTRIITSEANVSKKDIDNSGKSLPKWMHKKFPLTKFIVFFLKNCLRPCSMAVILALIIAFIPWVKALFVTSDHTPHIKQAPDHQPALSFIMDYTGYVGAASVPFGLLLLGGTLGRLKIGKLYPGFWKAAVVLVFLRQCIMPIFGVLWCDRLVKAGWLTWEKDKMLLFVIAISWDLPTMTTLIYFTASYTPVDMPNPIQMECVSFFLMIQYPLMVISLPFLVTYFLKVQMKV